MHKRQNKSLKKIYYSLKSFLHYLKSLFASKALRLQVLLLLLHWRRAVTQDVQQPAAQQPLAEPAEQAELTLRGRKCVVSFGEALL